MLCGGEVNFIITADLHGRLAEFALLAPQIRAYPQAVKVDLGDFAQGNFPVVQQGGSPVIEAFNALGYEILVPGNHDLEFPVDVMCRWQREFNGKILGAQWSLGNFRMPGSVVVERDGLRIGVIALGEWGVQKRAPFWPELSYGDEVAAINRQMEILRAGNCHAILLMCHISSGNYPLLNRILSEFPEIDAVVGAHSHRDMPGGIIRRVLVAQPAAHAASAVLLTLHFSDEKRLRFIQSRLIYPAENADEAVLAIARRAGAASSAAGNEALAGFPDAAALGRFSAEAVRRSVNADAAIIGFDPGKFHRELTVGRIFELFPYGNRIAVVTVSGETARQLLNRRRKGMRFFGAGDFSGSSIRLAVNDYILISTAQFNGLPAEITGIFERETIIEALKCREYSENTP